MGRQEQIDLLLEHYENPRHYGAMQDATVVHKGVNPGCGDVVTFYLRLDGDGNIADISFEGEGCTLSQAASSMVTEMFYGKTVEDIENAPADSIVELLGRELAGARLKCATLGLNTTKEAVRMARRRQ